MGGKIRRGDIETIRAAIWLSDMRDFTGRADRMAPRALIDLLNRYFDCQVPAIRERGGEVLKFMGDGLLAIFPIETEGAVELVCRNVLGAARKARADVAAADWSGIDAGKGGGGAMEAPGFGLALHLGEVLYGNIGSGNRLDFTCIGPAINLTARIEKLTASTGQTILASADFAQACAAEVQSGALMPIGEFALKGIEAKQAVFGLG
jgi:adenylate cyclase